MSEESRYLHGHHDSVLASHGWRTAENSAAYFTQVLEDDWVVLDIGCGPATITADLSALVPRGKVIGIDRTLEILTQAAGTSPATPMVMADVYALPFAEHSVDAVHLHMVLQHLPDPVGALRALRAVVRPGGVIAARDSNYSAMRWEPESPLISRWRELYDQTARCVGGEPDAGAFYAEWAESAGCSDVTVTESTWVYSTPAERSWWGTLWAERVVSSSFADVALANQLAQRSELEELSAGWRAFAEAPSGRFEIPCAEMIIRV